MSDKSTVPPAAGPAAEPPLRRSLSLTLLTLYGLGVTIGAGIFVLVGKISGIAGVHAPLAFVVAATLAGLSALSFAELSARFPESAGEAAYVREGLRSRPLAFAAGLMVAFVGIVSSAAIVNGFVGYLAALVAFDPALTLAFAAATVVGITVIAAMGIGSSVAVAAVLSVAEIGALVAVIAAAVYGDGPGVLAPSASVVPAVSPPDMAAWLGVMSGAVLAFFAFIGFEDIVNVAEETRDAERTVPRAIFLTLLFTVILYVAVTVVADAVADPAELAASDAPLVLVFERASGLSGRPIALVAVLAVLNGALIQIIMASRVLYGMARRGLLPAGLGRVDPRSRTPLIATAVVGGLLLAFALALPVVALARVTTFVALTIFILVNASLVGLRWRERAVGGAPVAGRRRLPLAVPCLGVAVCAALLFFQAWEAVWG